MTPHSTSSDAIASTRCVTVESFGVGADGVDVQAFTLRNAAGSEVQFLSRGGIIRSIRMPDRAGTLGEMVLGFDTLEEYEREALYLGALVGRFANRIAGARFALDAQEHVVSANEPPNCLHGGHAGFDSKSWEVEPFEHATAVGATLRYVSADGEEGFPGELTVDVTYTLHDDDTLVVEYAAESTAATPVSLTQHAFFNLSGVSGSDILDHELMIAASAYTPVDARLIPLGMCEDVGGTPFDLREARRIGDGLDIEHAQLAIGAGYDHNFVIDGYAGRDAARVPCARLHHPASGRTMTVSTSEPGLQVCTANLHGTGRTGRDGSPLVRHGGVALETQAFPDSPNQPTFPSCIVRPGAPYRSSTAFAFSVDG